MELSLRNSRESDLEVFFINQTDEEANHMAAFTPKDPNNREAYMTKWRRLLQDDSIKMQTILQGGQVIGGVVKFVMEGDAEITYAISKEYWGQGLTTKAVKLFLDKEKTRPIYGRTAYDNIGSQRILEKTGFERIAKEMGFANARGTEIEEFIYKLDG